MDSAKVENYAVLAKPAANNTRVRLPATWRACMHTSATRLPAGHAPSSNQQRNISELR